MHIDSRHPKTCLNSVDFTWWMVYLSVQTVVLCLQGSDVGPRPEADKPPALSYNLQPAAWLHSAQLETRMYACLKQAQGCDENTKAFLQKHHIHFHFKQKEITLLRCLMHLWCRSDVLPQKRSALNKQCSREICFKQANPLFWQRGIMLLVCSSVSGISLSRHCFETSLNKANHCRHIKKSLPHEKLTGKSN